MVGMAVLCLVGLYQKLRDKAAPQKMPALRQRIVTPTNDSAGYWLSIGTNVLFAIVFSMAAYLTAFP